MQALIARRVDCPWLRDRPTPPIPLQVWPILSRNGRPPQSDSGSKERRRGFQPISNSRWSVRLSLDANIAENYGKQRLKSPLQNTWSSTQSSINFTKCKLC